MLDTHRVPVDGADAGLVTGTVEADDVEAGRGDAVNVRDELSLLITGAHNRRTREAG
ncbi:hypothetical protein [Bifidobacterium oedipodis]|uniref:Uncharacterized protein n=1 Tax=Bifidobacterium oedipodis TaxID=2675322 RepID=A0A7Y0HSR0_9BIFI|nr:hypothetical protein [Bifidobacterium sp. DSM 109957]NMM93858.1 hypothetical protein [Bifidobacterium sp. DSM 109957]